MNISDLDPIIIESLNENGKLVAANYKILKQAGIENPKALIPYKPELFLSSRKLVIKMLKKINIEKVNEDPSSILEMF